MRWSRLYAPLQASRGAASILVQHYGISAETMRRWRKRGASDCLDRSTRAHRLSWKTTEEESAIIGTLRHATSFP